MKAWTPERKLKLSLARKGILFTPKHRENLRKSHIGKKLSEEQRKKISEANKGSNHWNWQGGKTSVNARIRHSPEMKEWRTQVFIRDKYTCCRCKKIGGRLNADHIKPFYRFPELRFEISNGRTLCLKCHRKIGKGWGANKMTKKEISRFGSLGGQATLQKYGTSHFNRIARIRWDKKRGVTVQLPILL